MVYNYMTRQQCVAFKSKIIKHMLQLPLLCHCVCMIADRIFPTSALHQGIQYCTVLQSSVVRDTYVGYISYSTYLRFYDGANGRALTFNSVGDFSGATSSCRRGRDEPCRLDLFGRRADIVKKKVSQKLVVSHCDSTPFRRVIFLKQQSLATFFLSFFCLPTKPNLQCTASRDGKMGKCDDPSLLLFYTAVGNTMTSSLRCSACWNSPGQVVAVTLFMSAMSRCK